MRQCSAGIRPGCRGACAAQTSRRKEGRKDVPVGGGANLDAGIDDVGDRLAERNHLAQRKDHHRLDAENIRPKADVL